jgi:TolB-like protein/Flp pilus assembly protein TadD
LLSELKRRNVIRVGAAYLVAAWLVIQVAETMFPLFGFDDTPARIVVVVLAIGFLPALVFAWAFELTPEGLKKERYVDRQHSITRHTGKRLDRVIMIILALAITYFAFDRFVVSDYREAKIAEQAREEGRTEALKEFKVGNSIAILSFANRSSDPDDAYFADGLADELLTVLAKVRELKVASRTSSFYFKDKNVGISEIASRLGVASVLSGSVQREGKRIRVTVTLDEAAGNTVLWSDSYDREVKNLLDIQSEIARSVTSAIVPVLSPESREVVRQRPTESFAAYDAYLQGRDFLRMPPDPFTVERSLEFFDKAISLDPEFAQAWAGRCSAFLSTYQLSRDNVSFETAEAACQRALTLDGAVYEVRNALGNLYRMSGQFDEAIVEYEAGLVQMPNSAGLHIGLAWSYYEENQLERAEQMFLRALDLESGYWLAHNEIGIFYGQEGRSDESIAQFRRVIELTPESGIGYDNLGNTLLSMGELEQARRVFEESPEPSRWTYENRALVNYYLGDFGKAIDDLRRAVELAPNNYKTWGDLADAYRHAGNADKARDAYEKAIELAEQALTIYPSDAQTIAKIGMYQAYTGDAESAQAKIDEAIRSGSSGVYYSAARVRMHYGDMEAAIALLRKTIEEGWSRSLVARDPDFVAAGGEDRFGQL